MANAEKFEGIDWAGLIADLERKYRRVGRLAKYEPAVEGRSLSDQIADAIAMMVAEVSAGEELPTDREQLMIIAGFKLTRVRRRDAALARRHSKGLEQLMVLGAEEESLIDALVREDGRKKLLDRLFEELKDDEETTRFLKLYTQPGHRLHSNKDFAALMGTEPLRIKYLKSKVALLSKRICASELGRVLPGRS